jgi:hypothetical protein
MSGVQPGATVTANGTAKTLSTRAEKKARVKTWAASMTEEARTEYMIGEQYASLSEKAQDIIAEAFGEIEDRAYEDSIGVENIDLNAPTPEVDEIVGDDEDDGTEEFYADPVDEAYQNGETYYYTGEES